MNNDSTNQKNTHKIIKTNKMKYLVNICRFIVGVIFIISGFVKAVDPIGFGYKLEEYFASDVFNIGFLHDLALPQATFFSIFEIMLGILLLLGVFRLFTNWALLMLIVFFSFLTFYSAYFNKVTDCGCFGDALHLEPWQSFQKDLVLLVLILVIFIGQKYIKPIFKSKKINFGLIAVSLLVCCWVSYTGIQKLPIIDFRPYAIGKSIPEGMKSAEELGKLPPQYQVTYTMKDMNTGETVKITDKEYLNNPKWYEEGTPWELMKDLTISKKIANGYEPPVHDFMLDCEGEDMTDAYLAEDKIVFFVTPFAEKLSKDDIDKLNQLYKDLEVKNIKAVGLTSGEIDNAIFPYCFVDQTTLKTMIRSNPGIVVLRKGIVVNKYHNHPIPNVEDIVKD